jgi:hypothetical protein
MPDAPPAPAPAALVLPALAEGGGLGASEPQPGTHNSAQQKPAPKANWNRFQIMPDDSACSTILQLRPTKIFAASRNEKLLYPVPE